jgi:hypothetical protein
MSNQDRRIWASGVYRTNQLLSPDGKRACKGDVLLTEVKSVLDSGEIIFVAPSNRRHVPKEDFPGDEYEPHPLFDNVWFEKET